MDALVFRSPKEAAERASERIAGLIASTSDRFSLGIAGGSTPEATYRSLRNHDLRWEHVQAWMTDERWVPHDHDRCNGRMAADALFDHVDTSFARPRWGGDVEPSQSAREYDALIRSMHRDRPPDLMMLGLGEDGHTASLFPDTLALDEKVRWYVSNYVAQQGEVRLTATYPLLWTATTTMVLAVGAGKAEAVKASFEGTTPAGRLAEGSGVVEWYLDEEAASLLA